MSEDNQIEESVGNQDDSTGDSFADAMSAIALISIAVVIAVYWVANQ